MTTTLISQNLKPKHTILSKLVEQIKPVFLYKVSRQSNEVIFDTYDSFICTATSVDNARNIHPSGDFNKNSGGWVKFKNINTLTVSMIGIADHSIKENTVIITSFNAG